MRRPAAAAATPDAGTRATPPGGQVRHHVVRTPHSAATRPHTHTLAGSRAPRLPSLLPQAEPPLQAWRLGWGALFSWQVWLRAGYSPGLP